jgi:hypothetical protein
MLWLPPVGWVGCVGKMGAAQATAIFRERRLDVLVQARLRQRVRHDRTGEKEQGEEKREL